MSNKNNKSKSLLLLSVLLIAVVAITVTVGLVSAKYVRENHIPGKITIRGDLAESIEVFEHTVTGNPDEYELSTAETLEGNEYLLMPGVDVPKDPAVRVVKYTGVNAYVYVEVISTADPDFVTFSLSDKWTKLDLSSAEGMTDRVIYYYNGALEADENGNLVLPILDGTGLTVSDKLPRTTQASVDFKAYIAQRTSAEATAADALSVFLANAEYFDSTAAPAETAGTGN